MRVTRSPVEDFRATPPTWRSAISDTSSSRWHSDSLLLARQGMSGMKASAGPVGRQVQDASFFIGVLRSKMNEILAEIGSLRAEIERHEKDVSQQGQLERTYETLLQEVKTLEGTLADHNLAVDKARTTAAPGEVAKYLSDLEDQNR